MRNTTLNRARTAIGAGVLAAMSLPLGLPVGAAAAADVLVSEHKVYVAEITNKGTPPSVEAVKAEVDRTLERWETETDGKLSIERVGEVAQFETATDCSNSGPIYKEAKALPQFAGVNWNAYNHLVVVTVPPCRDHGVGSMPTGFGFDHGGNILYGYSTRDTQTLFHELGHNFALGHATAWAFDGTSWTNSEYGNRYSPMGTSVTTDPAYTHGSLDSFERTVLGVAGLGEVRQEALASDRRVRSFEIDLRGRGTDAGVRGLQLTDPKDGATYFVDFRSGAGRDRQSYYGVKDAATYTGPWNKGVTVQKVFTKSDRPVSELQPHTGTDGKVRYALTAGQSYRTDVDGNGQEIGLAIEVEQLALTGSVDDLATLKVTLTDERVPLSQQTGSVSVSGRGGVGDTMTATVGAWTAGSALSAITWYDGEEAIPGAVGATYVIPADLQGHRLTARVTGTQESYAPLTATSDAVLVGDGLQRFLGEGEVFEIRSVSTGYLLTNPGSKQLTAASAPASGPTAGQRWTVDSVQADGSFRLVNVSSGKCLDNSGASTVVGSPTIQYSCHTNTNQRWKIVGVGTGYKLVNMKSSLTTAPGSAADGALLAQSGDAYAWTFTQTPSGMG